MPARSHRSSSRGQVVIIVAFAMMTLMAVGAIVVDLGLSWMLRRHEQNAADPAAIAAAAYIEEGDVTAMHTAACFYAQENGFFTTDNATCDAARASGDLQVQWPPASGPFEGNTGMVQVIITDEHPSFFGRIFGQETATVASSAVAAREQTSANSNSLVALDPHTCAAGKTHGNGTITIDPVVNPETLQPYNGGFVHVNSDCNVDGVYDDACSTGSGAFKQGGNAGTEIIAPMIYIMGTCEEAGGSVASPVKEGAGRAPDPMWGLHGPRQQGWPAGWCPVQNGQTLAYEQSEPGDDGCQWSKKDTTITLTPGVYYGGWDFAGQNVTIKLDPGIYIIAGGGITIKGEAELDSTPDVIGGDPNPVVDPARVMIFSTDNTTDPACASSTEDRCIQGMIDIAGQSSLRIWGLDAGPWRGLLMWQDRRGSNPTAPIHLVGQGVLDLAGTIYAPRAHVKITGNGEAEGTRLAVQVISWTWDVGGNGDLYMPYDPSNLYRFIQQGLVH